MEFNVFVEKSRKCTMKKEKGKVMNIYNITIKIMEIYTKLFYKYEVIGAENVPDIGNIIIAANHKSNLDPVFIAAAIQNRKISVIAKKELFKNKLIGSYLNHINVIPIDRNNPGISALKSVLKEIKNGNAVGIFPEGTRCKGREFGKAKAGLGMLAVKGKASVVPVSIITDYKLFKKVKIYIGSPISMEQYYGEKLSSKEFERISQDVLDIIEKNYIEN